ncbi:MAG TPA: hypothetical protein VFN67_05375 [Polyangiales bacterium]|nr:hypothetical protein [Polyangiales bacterium]
MNQAQLKQTEQVSIPYVEPDAGDEPKTNPRIRVPLPAAPEESGVVQRVRAAAPRDLLRDLLRGVLDAQRALSRLRVAPAVIIGALLGSAPYLVQEHARARSSLEEQPRMLVRQLPKREAETSQLAAAAQPPAPQPPPAYVEVFEEDTTVVQARPTRNAIEHALLQRARSLLRNGDAIGAKLVLERLARHTPHGSMVKQRKLLEIQVLQVIGGKAAAKRAASAFAKAYPHSPELAKLSNLLL